MKAQLLLVGGRPMPNILTLIYGKPDLVVAVCSEQSINEEWPKLKQGIKNLLPSCQIHEATVDGFALPQIRRTCEDALNICPNAEWIVNVTSGTAVMSIGAYEAAKYYTGKAPMKCWYLDTANSRVSALIGEPGTRDIFRLKVEQYAAAYNVRLVPGSLEDQRKYSEEHWVPFVQVVARNPHMIDSLKTVVKSLTGISKEKGLVRCSIVDKNTTLYALLEEAARVELLYDLERIGEKVSFRISFIQVNFLKGPWLEAYVWDEMVKTDLFSDCRWNQKIFDEQKPTDKENKNELDVSMIYNAQLHVVECKTGDESFKSETLYTLDSVVNPLGGRFVSRFLVSSLPVPSDREGNKNFESFKEKARERGITLITRENLPNVANIISTSVLRANHR